MKFFVLFVMLVLCLLSNYFYSKPVNAMVEAWAQSNGYKILEKQRSWFPPIGMWLTQRRSQSFVHIKVLDTSTHRIRNGYLRLSSHWWGAMKIDVDEVRWQDE